MGYSAWVDFSGSSIGPITGAYLNGVYYDLTGDWEITGTTPPHHPGLCEFFREVVRRLSPGAS